MSINYSASVLTHVKCIQNRYTEMYFNIMLSTHTYYSQNKSTDNKLLRLKPFRYGMFRFKMLKETSIPIASKNTPSYTISLVSKTD